MKNLIEEIKNNKLDIEKHNELFASAWNSSIDNCCSVLNQYNIITAPKSIKLSEIVSRLEINFRENIRLNGYHKKIIGFDYLDFDGCWEFCYLFELDENMKIANIQYDMIGNEFKWLYTLWIAGTEIVDDLECDE